MKVVGAPMYKFSFEDKPLFELDDSLPSEEKLETLFRQVYWLHQTTMIMHKKGKKSPLPKILALKDQNAQAYLKHFAYEIVHKESKDPEEL